MSTCKARVKFLPVFPSQVGTSLGIERVFCQYSDWWMNISEDIYIFLVYFSWDPFMTRRFNFLMLSLGWGRSVSAACSIDWGGGGCGSGSGGSGGVVGVIWRSAFCSRAASCSWSVRTSCAIDCSLVFRTSVSIAVRSYSSFSAPKILAASQTLLPFSRSLAHSEACCW